MVRGSTKCLVGSPSISLLGLHPDLYAPGTTIFALTQSTTAIERANLPSSESEDRSLLEEGAIQVLPRSGYSYYLGQSERMNG